MGALLVEDGRAYIVLCLLVDDEQHTIILCIVDDFM